MGWTLPSCMIDLETKIAQFSGAYNPFFLIRNNELTIVKGDRMPIGVYPRDFAKQNELTIIFVNTEKHSAQFDGGTLVAPKELVHQLLKTGLPES